MLVTMIREVELWLKLKNIYRRALLTSVDASLSSPFRGYCMQHGLTTGSASMPSTPFMAVSLDER